MKEGLHVSYPGACEGFRGHAGCPALPALDKPDLSPLEATPSTAPCWNVHEIAHEKGLVRVDVCELQGQAGHSQPSEEIRHCEGSHQRGGSDTAWSCHSFRASVGLAVLCPSDQASKARIERTPKRRRRQEEGDVSQENLAASSPTISQVESHTDLQENEETME